MNDRIFLIDSDSLETVQSRLYGYAVGGNGEFFIDTVPDCVPCTGVYVMVEAGEEGIRISRDPCGSFGLYVFRSGSRFLVSNSFFRIAEQLKGRLHIRRGAVDALLYGMYVPLSDMETLAEEIVCLRPGASILIDRKKRSMRIEDTGIPPLFTRRCEDAESLEILDRWYFRWVSVFRNLALSGYPIRADLSGGMDTRIILSMLLRSGIALESIRFDSHSQVHLAKDSEDYEIAQEIAAHYGFELNSDGAFPTCRTGRLPPEESFAAARYTSLGSGITYKYLLCDYDSPVISLKGLGSLVKGWDWKSPEDAVRAHLKFGFSPFTGQSGKTRFLEYGPVCIRLWKAYRRSVSDMLQGFPWRDDRAGSLVFFRQIVCRMDMGKIRDWMCGNQITVTPFTDPDILDFYYCLNTGDRRALAALILQRYCPELLQFRVQGTKLDRNMIETVRNLSGAAEPAGTAASGRIVCHPKPVGKRTLSRSDLERHLRETAFSEEFLRILLDYVPKRRLEDAMKLASGETLNSNSMHLNALLAVYELAKLAGKRENGGEGADGGTGEGPDMGGMRTE